MRSPHCTEQAHDYIAHHHSTAQTYNVGWQDRNYSDADEATASQKLSANNTIQLDF